MHAVNPAVERCRRMRIECFNARRRKGRRESVATRSRIPTRLYKLQISRSTTLKWHQHGEPPSFIRFSRRPRWATSARARINVANKFRTQKIDTIRMTPRKILINGIPYRLLLFLFFLMRMRMKGYGYMLLCAILWLCRIRKKIVDAIRCNRVDGHSKRHRAL